MIIHNKSKTPEYRSWTGMMQRCKNSNADRYGSYGGRGIRVCDRWEKFLSFYADMGDKPSKEHSIDRIDNDGNYTPENCRWATRSQQQLNKRKHDYANLPRGDDHWTRKYPDKAREVALKNIVNAHGSLENNNNAKMTRKTASQMRRYFKNNQHLEMVDVGSVFGVGRETARKVVKRILW